MISRNQRTVRGTGRFALTIFALAALAGCTDWAGYDLDYLIARPDFIATMRTSVAFDPNMLPLLPAEGTVPVISPMGEMPAPFTQAELDSVAATFTNPLEATPEVLARGGLVFHRNCFVCHGSDGTGTGPIVGNGRFPLGPSLVNADAVGRSDGYIYSVIRVGRGLMPAYGPRIPESDRWAVVHYVRQLQSAAATGTPPPPPPPGP